MDMEIKIKMCLFIIWWKTIQFNLDSTKIYWIEFDSTKTYWIEFDSIQFKLNWIEYKFHSMYLNSNKIQLSCI
jgi:hypothetical protein